MKQKLFKNCLLYLLTLSLSAILLTSCGETDEEEAKVIKTGYIVDGPIRGLTYKTDTLNGTTDANGKFEYIDKEYVEFFIGSLKLGAKIKAKSQLTPVDLVPFAYSKLSHPYVTNILRLLQSLDENNNHDDGISISANAAKVFDADTVKLAIDFNKMPDEFGQTIETEKIFDKLEEVGAFTDQENRDLKTAAEAQEIMRQTLATIEPPIDYTNTKINIDVTTPFSKYPMMGYYDRVEEIKLVKTGGSEPVDITVVIDDYFGYRKDLDLDLGINTYEITAYRYQKIIAIDSWNIKYDPSYSIKDRALLYCSPIRGTDKFTETFIIDLEQQQKVLGLIQNVNIVAISPNKKYIIGNLGEVYSTEDHTRIKENDGTDMDIAEEPKRDAFYQPIMSTTLFNTPEINPVCFEKNSDTYCLAGSEIMYISDDMKTRQILSLNMQASFSTLKVKPYFVNNDLIVGVMTDSKRTDSVTGKLQYEVFRQISLPESNTLYTPTSKSIYVNESDTALRLNRRYCAITPDGKIGVFSSASEPYGAVDIMVFDNINQVNQIYSFDALFDMMGQISFSPDYLFAYVGATGSSWYGGGGVYAFDLKNFKKVTSYPIYGASSVSVGSDGLIYLTSYFSEPTDAGLNNRINTKTSLAKRGIEVLEFKDNKFAYKNSVYLRLLRDAALVIKEK